MDIKQINLSPKILSLFIILIIIFKELLFINNEISNNLSPIADPYSEANVIRGAEGFYDEGLFKTNGLSNIAYGNRFLETGIKIEPGYEKTTKYIYTHYPPGPEYFVYLSNILFGKENIKIARMFPLIINFLALLFFLNTSQKYFGSWKTFIFLLIFSIIPMATNMLHGLHSHGYAIAYFILQISLGIKIFSKSKAEKLDIILLFIISFLQGYNSFDQCFIAIFSTIPLFFLFDLKKNIKLLILMIFISGLGFTIAHILHFLQVVSYYNSWTLAYNDLFNAYETRSHGDGHLNRIPLILYYFSLMKQENYAGEIVPQLLTCLTLFFAFIGKRELKISSNIKFGISIEWAYTKILSVFFAFIVSILWLVFMPQHATAHPHYIPRTYLPIYFFWALALISSIRIREDTSTPLKLSRNEELFWKYGTSIIFTIIGTKLCWDFFGSGFLSPESINYINSSLLDPVNATQKILYFFNSFWSGIEAITLLHFIIFWSSLAIIYNKINSKYSYLIFLLGIFPPVFLKLGIFWEVIRNSILIFFAFSILYKNRKKALLSIPIIIFCYFFFNSTIYFIYSIPFIYIIFNEFIDNKKLIFFMLTSILIIFTLISGNTYLKVLKTYDLAGIQFLTQDKEIAKELNLPEISEYSTYRSDSLFKNPINTENHNLIKNILIYPLEYLSHRVNIFLNILSRDGKACYAFQIGSTFNPWGINQEWNVHHKALNNLFLSGSDQEHIFYSTNPIFWGFTYFILTICFLILSHKKNYNKYILALTYSNIISWICNFFFAVNCDSRNIFWIQISSLLILLIIIICKLEKDETNLSK